MDRQIYQDIAIFISRRCLFYYTVPPTYPTLIFQPDMHKILTFFFPLIIQVCKAVLNSQIASVTAPFIFT